MRFLSHLVTRLGYMKEGQHGRRVKKASPLTWTNRSWIGPALFGSGASGESRGGLAACRAFRLGIASRAESTSDAARARLCVMVGWNDVYAYVT